jgi:hypothetical protein
MHITGIFRWLLAAPLVLSGCTFDPGACASSHRELELRGALTGPAVGPGAAPIAAVLQLNESRGGDAAYRTLALQLAGTVPAAAEVLELRDAGGATASVLATFPPPHGGAVWASSFDVASSFPTQETLTAMAEDAGLVLTARKASGDAPVLAAALVVVRRTDWRHLRCD